jgi:hypothetical protein
MHISFKKSKIILCQLQKQDHLQEQEEADRETPQRQQARVH